ncbi:hypothetical protein MNV49_003494, partial [Pseudohyphozyma bogoriensis]
KMPTQSTEETAPLLANNTTSGTYQAVPSSAPTPGSNAAPAIADENEDDDQVIPDKTPAERRKSLYRWLAFWLVFAGFTTFLVVEAFERGEGEFDFKGALKKAAGGGVAGALSMVIQVLTLMPLRTVMNYQYRYGGTMVGSTEKLYAEGRLKRFYSGLGPALVQGPIARFGDTFANAGIFALLASNPFLAKLPSPVKSIFASVAGALFRMILVPVDTLKTAMQTDGSNGVRLLKERIKAYGIGTLWYGAFATALASFVGSYPWFATYNFLYANLPPPAPDSLLQKLIRQAFIGFIASVISDTVSNSLRVLKTFRQVHASKVGYVESAKRIVRQDGWAGLFGRGLRTRILSNGLQGLMFSILWKLFQDAIEKRWK